MEPMVVPGTLDALSAIRGYIKEAGEKAGLDRKSIYRLSLAVDEIATNIVIHGYEETGLSGDIRISSSLQPESLLILLEDNGIEYFPYENRPDSIDKPIEERPIGGLGIFLAGEGVDEFRYRREGNRNLHSFRVNLNAFS